MSNIENADPPSTSELVISVEDPLSNVSVNADIVEDEPLVITVTLKI
jgi:hypothetical protein